MRLIVAKRVDEEANKRTNFDQYWRLKMIWLKKHTALFILTLFLLPLVMLQGCGNKHDTAPSGSTITINPQDMSVSGLETYGDMTVNYTATLTYSDGTPIPDTALTIDGGFAAPVTSTTGTYKTPFYQFWHYENANANADNVAENKGYTAITDKSGSYKFSIQIYSMVSLTANGPLSKNAFSDKISVTSGAAVGSTKITVN